MLLCVLVMTTQRRETQHCRFVGLHEIDDVLNGALGLLEAQGAAVASCLSQAAGRVGCFFIGGFRPGFLAKLWVRFRGVVAHCEHAWIFELNAGYGKGRQFLPEVHDRLSGGIESGKKRGKFTEVFGTGCRGEGQAADFPLVHGVDHTGDHQHLLRTHFEMTLAQKEKVILQPYRHRLFMSERLNEREHGVDGFVESRIGAAVNLRGLDQRIQLGDELEAQHHQLLVEDIAGF